MPETLTKKQLNKAVKSDKVLPRGRLGILFGASSGFMSATAGIGGPAMVSTQS